MKYMRVHSLNYIMLTEIYMIINVHAGIYTKPRVDLTNEKKPSLKKWYFQLSELRAVRYVCGRNKASKARH